MELTDYIVYLWFFPVGAFLLVLVLTCLGLVVSVIKRVGLNILGDKETTFKASNA